MTVLIAGGGIAGLALGLTCHQIGVPFKIYESVSELRPLGVGINLQPTAVRELMDMGLASELDAIGVQTRDYGMYNRHGQRIWVEPRGTWAGYTWPQYSVHRGHLHMMLYRALIARAGAGCIETGWSATGGTTQAGQAVLSLQHKSGQAKTETGDLIIGADGIHSALRAGVAPAEGPPKWGGTVMWRGTAQAAPFHTGASMVMIGGQGIRFVTYPITRPDPDTGLAMTNWIALLTLDPDAEWRKEDWNRQADLADFLPQFETLQVDWLDIPGLIKGTDQVFEYPMVDRDPLPRWTHGRVSLMGDAAHPAYPVGSNGAGSAIMDARVLGAAFLAHGVGPDALETYEAQMRPLTSKVTLMNRVAGPDSILDEVDARSDGARFDGIHTVISEAELAAHAARYKQTAGYSVEAANAAPHTIAPGSRLGQ